MHNVTKILTDSKEFHEVVELSMDVSAHGYRTFHLQTVIYIYLEINTSNKF